MEQSLIQKIKEGLYLDGLDPKSYSPLSLAYIGDAIYEIVIRTIVMSAGNMSVNKYHKKSSSMVKASAQKEVFEKIEPFLTEGLQKSNWSGSFGWIFISGRRYGPHHRIDRDRF